MVGSERVATCLRLRNRAAFWLVYPCLGYKPLTGVDMPLRAVKGWGINESNPRALKEPVGVAGYKNAVGAPNPDGVCAKIL